MLLLALSIAGAAAQPATAVEPDLKQLFVFATVERRPSFKSTTRVRIGTFEPFQDDPRRTYWFTRERENDQKQVTDRAVTSTQACPASLPIVQSLEKLELPRPDVLGYRRDYDLIITDGIHYRLSGVVRHPDGQPGDFSIESNRRTPLARWTDELFGALEPCWRPLPAS
jgi:hypothetical protein